MYRGGKTGIYSNNPSLRRFKDNCDVGISSDLKPSIQPEAFRKFGNDDASMLQAEDYAKGQSAPPGFAKREGSLNKNGTPFNTHGEFQAFEEKVRGFDEKFDVVQKMIGETMMKIKGFESDIRMINDRASKDKRQTESDTDNSIQKKLPRAPKQEWTQKGAERELKTSGLQTQLEHVHTTIQKLSVEHAIQREQLNSLSESGPLEERKRLGSQSIELLEKLDTIVQQVGESIRGYLGKYDEHMTVITSNHLDALRKTVEGNLDLWNEERRQKAEFEKERLREHAGVVGWYQREIEQLQRNNADKETALEQLRTESLGERERLSNQYKKELNDKVLECSRLLEAHRRRQERLVSWHSRKADETNNKWLEKLDSVQKQNIRLLRERIQEQADCQMEIRKSDERVQDLTSDLIHFKQELKTVGERNQELEKLLSTSKQNIPHEDVEAVRKELKELHVQLKDNLVETEQLRKTKWVLQEQLRDSEIELDSHRQEITKCKSRLEEAPQEIEALRNAHQAAAQQLQEDFAREKALTEENHERQIRVGKEKLERLEQLVGSLRSSNHEQAEHHRKVLEENTHRWQDDAQRMRTEWQAELDESRRLVHEEKANTHKSDARIEILRRETEEAHARSLELASELEEARDAQRSALQTWEELKLASQDASKDMEDLRQALLRAEDEKRALSERVSQLDAESQARAAENESLESRLRDVTGSLAAKTEEASSAAEESRERGRQLAESRAQATHGETRLEQARLALREERATSERRAADLAARAEEARREVEDTLTRALEREEARRVLVFNEFQKLRKEIRVMCRIRPPPPPAAAVEGSSNSSSSRSSDAPAVLEYETSEGRFHGKPAGLEIISQKALYGTATQVEDRTKHYHFDRVFEAHETNQDVWLEIGQFVQSFVEGRQVTIFCYGQTATGKTYTMSNSAPGAVDDKGQPDLTHEGIMPRSKALIFEEADRRRERGWAVAVRGCCYEVYVREIRLLLPGRVVKTKSLDPTGPPWWCVRDPEYQVLDSAADFDAMFLGAMESRTFAATTSNSSSSRSHFILYLEFEARSPTMRRPTKGSLCLVDLAGSEDPHKASAPLDDRAMPGRGSAVAAGGPEEAERRRIREQCLKEGIAINQSLRVLRKSVSRIRNPTAANGKPTLEGGDEESSTLAKLLGPCLGRESMVLMFVMINLGADSLAETKATLECGKEIAEIKLSPKRTPQQPPSADETSAAEGKRAEAVKSPPNPMKPAVGRNSRNSRAPRPQ
ncbi:putative kinesin motor domain-containing protein [Rosellinia necatrix]|uniref:Putative kinesin motor domain-containing protein n=1 Tax=Rosellinia necatrix TaxID=77044 RepID=A0A1S8A4U6_ROSNE|nr:putative kinesin motor domain-containing protein [Rosellinia necatrix]